MIFHVATYLPVPYLAWKLKGFGRSVVTLTKMAAIFFRFLANALPREPLVRITRAFACRHIHH